ncbi:glycosyltransferase family 2 protein [Caballeronia ptereochthonis]|uniref:Glycosyl transferase family protein n=1 Tax=Caballeronia ptereochthonis TaxID=1777144 RepID=A0A158AFU3_9BURK|nr:glycosyltransferase family A protein [Caballeronia ptereochthonis]SAK56721.1 glycosyl transferase family protein [Caballeronia ptereochthonis]
MSTYTGLFENGETSATNAPTLPRGDFIPDVSVVVPTYRRPAMLERCVLALAAQAYDPARYEIIVCDDGPDEATRACVLRLARQHAEHGPRIRYVPVTATQGPAGARNAGWRASLARSIAFTDDDTIPDPRWLANGMRAIDAGADAVSGRIVVPLPKRPTDYELDAAGLVAAEFATANAFATRAALERTGGFDARFTAAWREDSDLQFTLMRAGLVIARADDAMVLHPVRPARWGVSISQQKKSQFDALLYKKHPELFRARIRRGPPLLYYAMFAALIAALLSLVAGAPEAALLAMLAWAMMTIRFTLKRLETAAHTPAHIAEMLWTSAVIPYLSIYWRIRGALKFRVLFL